MGEILNKFRIGAIWKATVNAKGKRKRLRNNKRRRYMPQDHPQDTHRRISPHRHHEGEDLEFVLRYLIYSKLVF